MAYQSDKAFLANKVYAVTSQDQTLQTVFTAPSGSRWQTMLVDSQSNGYQGALLKNLDTGNYEFVNRGTELFVAGRVVETYRDVAADLAMGVQKIPDQASSGRAFLELAKREILRSGGNPNSDLGITGHSLGGAISHILGAENPQLPVTTFNAYGAGNLIADGPYNNITNHVMALDPVSVAPGSKMPGSTLMYHEADNPAGNSAASALTLGLR